MREVGQVDERTGGLSGKDIDFNKVKDKEVKSEDAIVAVVKDMEATYENVLHN